MTSTTGPEAGARTGGAPRDGGRTGRDLSPLLELGFVALGLVGYLLVRWYTLGRTDEAVANARQVLALEEALGFDREYAVQAATYASAPWLGHAATQFYVWGYFPVLVATATWL